MTETTKKKKFDDEFAINDKESCAKAIRNGGIAAMISATITGIFSVAGLFINSSDAKLNYLLDPWMLIDVALIIVLAIFIFRKSRAAATIMVIYFIGCKILIWSDLGSLTGWPVALILIVYYVNAMKGTYIWHSKYREVLDPENG